MQDCLEGSKPSPESAKGEITEKKITKFKLEKISITTVKRKI